MPPVDSRQEGEVPDAVKRVKRIHSARASLVKHLQAAQEYQSQYYNKKHKQEIFQKGDLVLLSTKHIQITRQPSKKLSSKFIGPFRVQDAVGTQAYRLILPPDYRIHNVFHISLLERWKPRKGEEDPNTLSPNITPEGEEVWEVEKIVAKRKRKGQQQYLLRWKGYDESWDTWTPESDFENMEDLLKEYEKGKEPLTRKKRSKH
jgi:hypothetical protein